MVSVIMPVYNSDKYVSTAIESVLNQTYRDFELLLVDDGSKDNSLDVCLDYQKKDARIKVLTKENGGLCSARNFGLDHAQGQYIAFIDNDDEFDAAYLQTAVDVLEKSGADIFRCNRKRVQTFDDGSTKTDISGVPKYKEYPHTVEADELFADYYHIKSSGAMYGIWNGVFKAELFQDVRFDVRIRRGGEDWLVNLQLYNKAKRVVFVNDALYFYYRRVSHSISAQFDYNRIEALEWISAYEDALLKEKLGKDSSKVRRAVAAIYLVHTVKILEHPGCDISRKEKYEHLKKLRQEKVFIGELRPHCFGSPLKENVCLWLYAHGHIKLMYNIIAKILKARGNT